MLEFKKETKWMVLEFCMMWICCPYEDGTCYDYHKVSHFHKSREGLILAEL